MQVKTRLPTLAEYLAAFEEQPVEIVDGEIIPMSPGGREQPNVETNTLILLQPYLKEHNWGKVFPEASFVLDGNRRKDWVKNARKPDIAFISKERIEAHNKKYPARSEPWWLAPDLAVESISPTDRFAAINRKVTDYLRYGARIVWLIDPEARTITIYTPDHPLKTLYDDDTLDAEPIIPGWSAPVAALFEEEE